MSVTIRDVAKEAGVSTSTVSKVLNNWSSISPETVRAFMRLLRNCNIRLTHEPSVLPEAPPEILYFYPACKKKKHITIRICLTFSAVYKKNCPLRDIP